MVQLSMDIATYFFINYLIYIYICDWWLVWNIFLHILEEYVQLTFIFFRWVGQPPSRFHMCIPMDPWPLPEKVRQTPLVIIAQTLSKKLLGSIGSI